MSTVYCRKIIRRNPFQIKKVPWPVRVYSAPFDRWNSLGRQALFGAPNFLFFLIYQKLWPFRNCGTFAYNINNETIPIFFNAKNTQFHSIYFKKFANGYEPQTTALVDVLLGKRDVFYDIGSNWGWFSLYAASKPGFEGSVHAFEPFRSSYADLCSIIKQANLKNRISAHFLALSDRVGTASMRLPDKFQSGQAIMEENAGGDSTATASIDSLNLPPPNLIKADVEGVELKVFKGGEKMLAQHQPMLIFENSRRADAPYQTLEPLAYLSKMGYEFFHVGWLRGEEPNLYLVGDDNDPSPQENENLALSPLKWNERLLRYDGLNIFACHRDKIPGLKSLFTEYHLE